MSNEQKELCREYWVNLNILNEEQASFKLKCLLEYIPREPISYNKLGYPVF